mgnify:CR=1 FL=1
MAKDDPNKTLPSDDPQHYRPVYDVEDLPDEERDIISRLTGRDEQIDVVVYSDLLESGTFGQSRLVLTDRSVVVAENAVPETQIPLERIASFHCREYVGNGILEVYMKDGRRYELVRYSKRVADAVQEVADHINGRVGVSEEEKEARQEETEKVAGPKDEKPTYRCPNCGYPLKHAGDVCPRCANKKREMARLMTYVVKHGWTFWLGCGLTVLVVGINLAPALLVRLLVDNVLEADGVAASTRYWRLGGLVGVFFSLIVFRLVIQYIRIRTMGNLAAGVIFDLRRKLYRALQRLSLSYYDRERTGRIMARVLNDTKGIQAFVVNGVQQIIMHGLMVVAIPILLFAANWKLALIALLPIPIVALVARVCAKRFSTAYRTLRRRFANLSATISESISGIRVVKSFAQEEREVYGFDQKARDVYDAHISAVRTRAYFKPSVMFMMTTGTILVWLFGGRAVIADPVAFTTGMLIQFISYMNMFYNPVQMLMQLTEMFQQTATASERVFSILDMPSEIADHENAVELKDVEGHLRLENVSFTYTEGERVLKNIDLDVKPGEMIGLVGETGSGKSTLVSLICRFYDPTKGRILLDGTDLPDIQVKSLRSNIGMVLQETFLFAGTLRENIAYGKPEATDIEIIQSAKAANAHDFIMNLPDGYDSEVGERGVGLSGGEKQRIAIARAVLKDPAILILDEATSAVDTATEQSIQDAMNRLVQGRTTFAIAHRLSTLRNADRLLVMQNGEVIEEGTHEDLIERGGVYADLCKIQADFARFVEEPRGNGREGNAKAESGSGCEKEKETEAAAASGKGK